MQPNTLEVGRESSHSLARPDQQRLVRESRLRCLCTVCAKPPRAVALYQRELEVAQAERLLVAADTLTDAREELAVSEKQMQRRTGS